MASSNERLPLSSTDRVRDINVEVASVDQLHKNALGMGSVLFACVACIAPMAAMFFNVPGMASQAGAATPLVFVLSAIGLLLLGVTIVYFARRLSSAGGFYTWVRHGLGRGPAFQAGWLMFGAYAIFEAASQAAFGGLTDLNVSTFLNVHVPGGWVFWTLLSVVVVSILAYFDVKLSIWILAPLAIAELACLLLLDLAITLKGGAAGHDLVHTFTPAGASLKGVAPGGLLGIGVAMALGIWSCIGFESGAVYGEEAKNPRRAIPVAIFSVLSLMAVLFIWTTYSATIGLGWQHAVDTLGNLSIAPQPYYTLATNYVGGWLQALMVVFVSTSTFASCIAFRNGMIRYLYAMGREQILPSSLGRTHPRWRSPWVANLVQTIFTLLVIIFLAFVIQKSNSDGSTSYALGIADGKVYTQTTGIGSYQWLAIIGTICLLIVYIMTNIAAPILARSRNEFRIGTHIVAPVLSTLALLIPLVSFVLPPVPLIGNFFTNLGFFPTPFPLNILPLFVIVWVIGGLVYSTYLSRSHPERYDRLGLILREDT
jgi:amino acid transporter